MNPFSQSLELQEDDANANMTLTPIFSGKFGNSSSISDQKRTENLGNKSDEGKARIIMRGVIEQDNEPVYFM